MERLLMSWFHESKYHPKVEELTNVIQQVTNLKDRHFIRIMVTHYFSILAGMQRAKVVTEHMGEMYINQYSCCLSPSGYGKNFTTNLLEQHILQPFIKVFEKNTVINVSDSNLDRLAILIATNTKEDYSKVLEDVVTEYESLGTPAYTYDQATSPALRQLRRKFQLAASGSLNLIVDEIGSNFNEIKEVFPDYLTMYDKGLLKQKITKVSKDALRGIELPDPVPATMLLFGTPSYLLDGGDTEESFFQQLETGYARRLMFSFADKEAEPSSKSAEEIYDQAVSALRLLPKSSGLEKLGEYKYHGRKILVERDIAIKLIDYRLHCEELAKARPEHQRIAKAGMKHRYYKVLKTLGSYAFIDGVGLATEDHLNYAITIVEDSGESFAKLNKRERSYIKLAKYFEDHAGDSLTKHDLVQDLPFFTGSESAKREMIELAMAYGFTNNIIISKRVTHGVEFFMGKQLKQTDLSSLIISISEDLAYGYDPLRVPFLEDHVKSDEDIPISDIVTTRGIHYCTHHFKGGHRTKDTALAPFNMVCLDVDDGTTLEEVRNVLSNYTYFIYTTKRHQIEEHGDRFRVIMPISHELALDKDEYTKFMENIALFMPFPIDDGTYDISRKWLAHDGEVFVNYSEETKLLDATSFIPDTRKSEEVIADIAKYDKNGKLTRWFFMEATDGNRNNTVLRYALALLDAGQDPDEIPDMVLEFNKLLPVPLPVGELESTVFTTLATKREEKYGR